MLITSGPPRRLGVPEDEATIRIGESPRQQGTAFGRRFLYLADRPAFELAMPCGTCPFLFQRQAGANRTVSLDEAADRLAAGVSTIDANIVALYGGLLPLGTYLPVILRLQPSLVLPASDSDYFTHDQVATWGIDPFWGVAENPRTPYYRTFQTSVNAEEHFYEFVVPMVPPTWNDRDRVQHYVERLTQGSNPTAVALSTLDVLQPATADESTDYYVHWCLTHFLLDGHHKMEAAALAGASVDVLALIAVDAGLAGEKDLSHLTAIRSREPARRGGGAD